MGERRQINLGCLQSIERRVFDRRELDRRKGDRRQSA
jgi:hypothetical protein